MENDQITEYEVCDWKEEQHWQVLPQSTCHPYQHLKFSLNKQRIQKEITAAIAHYIATDMAPKATVEQQHGLNISLTANILFPTSYK